MTYRTTFALDQPTAARLKRLATRWRVSQAEVVRRAVAEAEANAAAKVADPAAALKQMVESGQGLEPAKADAYLKQVRADRKRWRAR
jgi:Arc/MetJ-type ribon-helix-helix transcriptional regulator